MSPFILSLYSFIRNHYLFRLPHGYPVYHILEQGNDRTESCFHKYDPHLSLSKSSVILPQHERIPEQHEQAPQDGRQRIDSAELIRRIFFI